MLHGFNRQQLNVQVRDGRIEAGLVLPYARGSWQANNRQPTKGASVSRRRSPVRRFEHFISQIKRGLHCTLKQKCEGMLSPRKSGQGVLETALKCTYLTAFRGRRCWNSSRERETEQQKNRKIRGIRYKRKQKVPKDKLK
jgi:hypothetical protein